MRLDRNAVQMYAVTDRSWLEKESLEEKVEQAIAGGITFLQIREKDMEEDEFIQSAKKICILARQKKIPVVINDNLSVALKAGADGVHIGQDDGDIALIRRAIGEEKILGVSVHTLEEALCAQEQGADYLGVGAVFSTATKQNTRQVSMKTLTEICNHVTIPVVAIGGIKKENIHMLHGSGVDGIAVVSAVFREQDTKQATESLKKLVERMLGADDANSK